MLCRRDHKFFILKSVSFSAGFIVVLCFFVLFLVRDCQLIPDYPHLERYFWPGHEKI